MKTFEKPIRSFERTELYNINFGTLEGEKDDKLSDSFFITNSIRKILGVKFNYILSPKGGGKSAFFRTINERLITSIHDFNYEKYCIVPVNNAFGFEEDCIAPELFKEESNRKRCTLAWAIYLIEQLIKDIQKNHSEKNGYSEFCDKIKRIADFKNKFQLQDVGDYLKQIKFKISFTAAGVPLEFEPSIKIEKQQEKLVLNNIFNHINDFYKSNNLLALILIDRLDNFVRTEEEVIQKKYIQGLIDCIEELSTHSNIKPLLLIRTDLFFAYEIDFEYDKVKERAIELSWQDGEILSFIVYRLLANKYIKENYSDYFNFIIKEGRDGGHRIYKNDESRFLKFFKFWNWFKKDELDFKRTIDYTTAEKFIRLFFPKNLEHFENIEFCLWIFEYFKDSNGFINLRLLISFFNLLIDAQLDFNAKMTINKVGTIEALNKNDGFSFELFSQEIFPEVYKKVQIDELRKVYKILKSENQQTLFKEINNRTVSKAVFSKGDFNIKKLNISNEEFDEVLKKLTLLGYCKNLDSKNYEVPKLFHCKITLQGRD